MNREYTLTEAAKRLAELKGKEMTIEAERPVREAEIRRLEAETNYRKQETERIAQEMERNRVLFPLEEQVKRAERNFREAQAKVAQMEAQYYPEKVETERLEAERRLKLIEQQTLTAQQELQKTTKELELLKEGMTREERASLDRVQTEFGRFRREWEMAAAKLGISAAEMFDMMRTLESVVWSSMAEIRARVRDPQVTARAAESPFRYWFSHADAEMRRPVRQKGLIFKEVDQEDLARRKYLIKTAIRMLEYSGIRAPDIYDKLVMWADSIGVPREELLKAMRGERSLLD
ncbi:MAG: hypothetical protein K6T27_09360 [Thermoleophilum sp.]|nr:hypothetical protein [Thermoleophilum sp.]